MVNRPLPLAVPLPVAVAKFRRVPYAELGIVPFD
jgi:hypothetical protein